MNMRNFFTYDPRAYFDLLEYADLEAADGALANLDIGKLIQTRDNYKIYQVAWNNNKKELKEIVFSTDLRGLQDYTNDNNKTYLIWDGGDAGDVSAQEIEYVYDANNDADTGTVSEYGNN